jgi:hypothetical protein
MNNVWYPEVLIISGGAFKGFSYLGALKALEDNKVDIYNIKTICGSSIGSIISLGITLGIPIKNIYDKIDIVRKNMEKILNKNKKILPLLSSTFSITDGSEIYDILKSSLNENNIDYKTFTFKDLYKLTGKDLIICVSNISIGKEVYFSKSHTPEYLVYEAVKISISIPFLFPVTKIDSHYYCDGDIFNPFPIGGCKKNIIKSAKKGNMIGITRQKKNINYKIENIIDYFNAIKNGCIGKFFYLSSEKYKKYLITIEDGELANLIIKDNDRDDYYKFGYEIGKKYILERGFPITQAQYYEQQKKSLKDLDQHDKVEH